MTDKDITQLNASLDTLMYLSEDKQLIQLASIVQQMLNEKVRSDPLGFKAEEKK